MSNTSIKIEHVSKEYRLGMIGGGTLYRDLQSWWARIRGKEDPNTVLYSEQLKEGESDRFLALDDISFEVKKGEALGIIGHNGAGKSTLLKLLSRVTTPTSGKISYNGRVASILEVGTGFHAELTGRENVYMNGAILGMTKAEIDSKFDEIVEFAEMEKFIDTPVKRYSSGMYVKLAFAVAAHLGSDILVMDEVLAVGDAKFQQKSLGKMNDSSQEEGKTVLYVSHNMNTIKQLCRRCVVLDHGHLVFDGDVDKAIEIYAQAQKGMEFFYDYTEVKRKHITSRRMEFLNLSILSDPSVELRVGMRIPMKLKAMANGEFKNMGIRFEIVASDNTVAGAAFTDGFFEAKEGDILYIEFEFNTENIAPGRYRVDMLAYEANEFGTQDFVDKVEGAFVLALEKAEDAVVEWLPQWWGHTRFNDAAVKKVEYV